MALVSPGLEVTVTDESQYVPAGVGTVPLVLLATAQNKIVNGSLATGTTKSAAGQLQIFSSQRELVSALGYPEFQQTAAGTPVHGSELNEYGLMAAYSALGLSNRLYAVRADIDLDQLRGTNVRPVGNVPDGTYWFDLAASTWGLYEWSEDTQQFVNKVPLLVTDESDVYYDSVDGGALSNVAIPLARVGAVGSYAVVTLTKENRVFYKTRFNQWVLVGSAEWQSAIPTVIGNVTNPTIDAVTAGNITINTVDVPLVDTYTLSDIVTAINSSAIPGVTAGIDNGRLVLFATRNAQSNGVDTDGIVNVLGSTTSVAVGILGGNYWTPTTYVGEFNNVPNWSYSGTTTRRNGSVWCKLNPTGGGSNFVFRRFNSLTGQWVSQAVKTYASAQAAVAGIDPSGGGQNIAEGVLFAQCAPDGLLPSNPTVTQSILGYLGFEFNVRGVYGQVVATTFAPPTSALVIGDSFEVFISQPTISTMSRYVVTLFGSGSMQSAASDFVSSLLGIGIPNLGASVNGDGTITLRHLAGGEIRLGRLSGNQDIPSVVGFDNATNTVTRGATKVISGFTDVGYVYSVVEPTADPVDDTLWYYSDATEIDIMVNAGVYWAGYKTISLDSRGYNLTQTDPMGVIVSASTPITQTDNTSLVPGDLWLDTSDLENYPKLSRWNGTTWVLIDSTDNVGQNGILFADARWSIDGTEDPIVGNLPSIQDMQYSSYVDLDCPDARLYPRGMLMFNMRRSGYNVKKFKANYFIAKDYTDLPTWNGGASYYIGQHVVYGDTIYTARVNVSPGGAAPNISVDWAPIQTNTWVSASGLKADGSMYAGSHAQRAIVIEALRNAVEQNTQIREDRFEFNLIVAPGFPELIPNMVALNNDRKQTAFVIGDTPMTLSSNVVEINNWSNGQSVDSLTTSSEYLAVYWPSGLSNDVQGNPIVVPPSHMALRTYLRNDNLAYPWFAPAGVRRGLVDNASDLGFIDANSGEFIRTGVNQGMRDSLYALAVNPITIIPGVGIVVWGQKTRSPQASAMDRVNVARLVNYIRTILQRSGNGFLFEPNDKITRDQLKQVVEGAFNDLIAKRGITDYVVVCDRSNNTPERIARNEMYVDVAIEPTRATEFIYVPIRLVNPGDLGGQAL